MSAGEVASFPRANGLFSVERSQPDGYSGDIQPDHAERLQALGVVKHLAVTLGLSSAVVERVENRQYVRGGQTDSVMALHYRGTRPDEAHAVLGSVFMNEAHTFGFDEEQRAALGAVAIDRTLRGLEPVALTPYATDARHVLRTHAYHVERPDNVVTLIPAHSIETVAPAQLA